MVYEKKTLLIVSIISFICGLFFYSLYTGTIIIRPIMNKVQARAYNPSSKKTVMLYYWNHQGWQKEICDVLFSDNLTTTATQVIRSWLNVLDEEGITKKKITLQSATVSSSLNELFISFDRNPLYKELAVFEKVMWIEGLLKTLRENDLIFTHIHFLVHHQPLNDPHLDFSQSWPMTGFIHSS